MAARGDLEVQELLQKLHLSEAEKEGVVLAQEDRGNLPEVKWMAVATLLTAKQFSEQSLMSTMVAAWNTAREVTFRPIGKNLFLIQAFCLGDWKRIMEEGPWIFRGNALMLEEFDGATPVPVVMPSKVQAWVQIHKIPHLYRTEAIIKQLAGKVGEVIGVELKVNSNGRGDFHRARVNIDSKKPLVRFVTLAPEGKECIIMQVKYEKMPRFCAHCGLMGHGQLECGTGEFSDEELQYGSWMLADYETWRAGTPRVRPVTADAGDRGGRAGARGRGRGRSGWAGAHWEGVWKEKSGKGEDSLGSRRRASRDADLDAEGQKLDDTASSPPKPEKKGNKNEDTSAKKKLILEDELVSAEKKVEVPPPPPHYVSPRDKKRLKKLDGHKEEGSTSKLVAGSEEELRRVQ